MKTIAFALLIAGVSAAQDEKKPETQAAIQLTDAEGGTLGGFVADKLDTNPTAEDLERAIIGKIDEIQKARSAEKKDDSGKGKGKKNRKKAGKKGGPDTSNTIKNGLTEQDRQAFGKFVVTEIAAEHKGQVLADAVKKELERLRAERVKASSTADSAPKKKKKKGNG